MPNDSIERECWAKNQLLCGCDEAGAGSGVGLLAVAAVIFPHNYDFSKLAVMGLNDSKKVLEWKRYPMADFIKQEALWWDCATATVDEIESGSIYKLRFSKGAELAEKAFKLYPNLSVLMDGNVAIKTVAPESKFLIKGDSLNYTLAAASIIAKTTKDKEMRSLDREFPGYKWSENKGYLTETHAEAIREYGLTKYHRASFCSKITKPSK